MEKDNKNNIQGIIESAIAGGIFGAALGAFITGKKKSTLIAALAGAAISASLKAIEEAKKLNRPVLYKESDCIYKVYPDGKKEFVKRIKKTNIEVPKNFSLE